MVFSNKKTWFGLNVVLYKNMVFGERMVSGESMVSGENIVFGEKCTTTDNSFFG